MRILTQMQYLRGLRALYPKSSTELSTSIVEKPDFQHRVSSLLITS